jgi:hypothetical protein
MVVTSQARVGYRAPLFGCGHQGYQLLIKHAFPAQHAFERRGGLVDKARVVIGVLDGYLRGDPGPGANAVHVNERRGVAKVDNNRGASANLSYQRPREPAIVLYSVHVCHFVHQD